MPRMNMNTPKITTRNLAPQEMIEDPDSLETQPVVYRKVLLRIVFWALGLAACFGAAGVIFAGHDTIWRIVGTCAATAAGAFLLLAISRQLDKETTWVPGALAISLIVIEYLGTLGMIWNLFRSAEEPAALTMLFLVATAVPAIGFTAILKRPDGVLSARVGLFASMMVFGLLMLGTWGGWLRTVNAEHWHSLGLSLAAFAALAVVSLIGSGLDRRHWRWLGVAAAGTAFAISAYAIIRDIHEASAWFVCIVSVAAVVAQANAMAWCPLKPAQRWLLMGDGRGRHRRRWICGLRENHGAVAGGNPWTPRRGGGHHRRLRNTGPADPREDQSASRSSARHFGGLA